VIATRLVVCLTLALLALPLAAQPVVDGVVNNGEYTYASGDWRMAWNATHLFVARVGTESGAVAVHLDTDPQSTPTNGNGNITAAPMSYDQASTPYMPRLPFRGDMRIMAGSASQNLSIADGNGGWVDGTQSDLTVATGNMVIEFSVRWDAIPSSFNWVGHQLLPGPMTQASNPMPAANTANGARLEYFYHVASTSSPTDPFGDRRSTWLVTNSADSGTYSLRNSIDSANNDDASTRRYIAFDVGATIDIESSLPLIIRTTTLDGGSQLTRVEGPGTNQSAECFNVFNAQNVIVRNFRIAHFDRAIIVGNTAHFATIAGNEIGTTGANLTGIQIENANNTTIGGPTAADRNVISGNTTGISISTTLDTLVTNNYIGTNVDGTAALANLNGITIENNSFATIGGLGLGNVISGNTNDAINVSDANDTVITGNLIGVGADGTTSIPNGGDGIDATNSVTIGSIGAGNVIAHNGGTGIRATGGNLVIRANSVFANATNFALTSAQAAPTIHQASSGDSNNLGLKLTITASNITTPAQSFLIDLYRNDNGPKTLVASSQCFSAGTGQWFVGSGFAPGDSLMAMVTSYETANCTNPGDGSSAPTSAFVVDNGSSTTTTLTSSAPTAWSGGSFTLTANIQSIDGFNPPTGSVTFKRNGTAVCENVAVLGTQVQCVVSATTEGVQSFEAIYSGDAYNDGSSDTEDVTVKMHVFSGTGNFTSTANWTENVLPAAGENFRIAGTATYDAQSFVTYGTMELGAGATMRTSDAYITTLRVTSITGTGTLDMSLGGYLSFTTSFADSVNFVRGTGMVTVAGTGALPAREFHHVGISGNATSTGPATIHGNLIVASGASFTPAHAITMRGAELRNEGTLQFATLNIASGVTTTVFHSFTATALDVDGTLDPHSGVVITGTTLTGSGTLYVNSTVTPRSFSAQYTAASKDATALTVIYNGPGAQSIDNLEYANLTLNNIFGASLPGRVTVNGVLTLTNGVLQTSSASTDLRVTNGAASAVVVTNGWVSGTGFYRKVPAGTHGGYVFPVGFPTTRAFLTVKFYDTPSDELVHSSVSTPADMGTNANGYGLDPARDANVFWRLSDTSATKYDVVLDYAAAGLVDAAANQSAFVFRSRHVVNNQFVWMHTAGVAVPGSMSATIFRQNTLIVYLTAGNQLADRTKSEITTTTSHLVSNGTSSTGVTVQLRDALNVNLNRGGDTVALQTTLGTLSAVTDQNDGTYTATLTSSSTAGTATITGTVNGGAITDTAVVTFGALGDASNLVATAATSTAITLTWTAAPGASGYAIERSALGGAFAQIGTSVGNAFTDGSATAAASYLYRVRATSGSSFSNYTNADLATTVIFTDPALTTGTAIKATHFNELRSAVNAVRALAGLSPFSFTNPPASGGTFRKSHVDELRTNLAAARSILGLATITFTDTTITAGSTRIKAAHVNELRGGTL
jgi:hypothetical protein